MASRPQRRLETGREVIVCGRGRFVECHLRDVARRGSSPARRVLRVEHGRHGRARSPATTRSSEAYGDPRQRRPPPAPWATGLSTVTATAERISPPAVGQSALVNRRVQVDARIVVDARGRRPGQRRTATHRPPTASLSPIRPDRGGPGADGLSAHGRGAGRPTFAYLGARRRRLVDRGDRPRRPLRSLRQRI